AVAHRYGRGQRAGSRPARRRWSARQSCGRGGCAPGVCTRLVSPASGRFGPTLWRAARARALCTLRDVVLERCHDPFFQLEDLLLQALDTLEDLDIALQQALVLLFLNVGLVGCVFERQAIADRLSIAGQQDQRRRVGRLRREGQVEEDERVQVEMEEYKVGVPGDPYGHDDG